MLMQLSIRNFTLIDHLDIELDHGMSVISGETGAGKSILLDALGLTLGDRADSEMIRTGTDKADISAHFSIDNIPQAKAWLEANDFDASDECLLRRVITQSGRSRAYLNGQPATAQQLRELGSLLIDIHGQHEHQTLLKKENHGPLIDLYGGNSTLANRVKDDFKAWQTTLRKLAQLNEQSAEQNAQIQLLKYQVEELDQLDLQPGELDQLEQEQQQLSSASDIISTGESVRQLTTENDEVCIHHQLNQALQQLSHLGLKNPQWESVQEMLNGALIQIEEASSELQHFLDKVEIDPSRLQTVEERLSSCYQIARKHLCQADDLPSLHDALADQLAALHHSDEDIETLAAHAEALKQAYLENANLLSTARQNAAANLNDSVNQQLHTLGMPDCHFKVALTAQSESATGLEHIELLISTNPGQPPRPLAKVASGGELSRISLAIQVATAQVSAMPVLAFDEVDVGIGGAIAEVVGKLLRQLGKNSQVLCVTHQPQVASCGDHHLQVQKYSNDDQAFSKIIKLDKPARVSEVARMLGGIEITQRSLDHAEEMLSLQHA